MHKPGRIRAEAAVSGTGLPTSALAERAADCAGGVLRSDANRIELGLECDVVGMSHIKRRRLQEIEVSCHAGNTRRRYVPFYFCPRSVMLYTNRMPTTDTRKAWRS
jgi:hypothetical protein